MKKIVAIVLSLVMVLGLATTAFGATVTKTWDDKYMYNTFSPATVADPATVGTVAFYKAVAPTYNEDGTVKTGGNIAYYTVQAMGDTTYYVEVGTLGEADIVLTNDAAAKVVFKYLNKVDNVDYLGNGVAFTNFGKACGQYNLKPAATDTYYTLDKVLYKAEVASATALMVDGKMVPVSVVGSAFNNHVATYTYNEKFEVTAVKCGLCGAAAVIAPNFASLPEGVVAVGVVNDVMPFYFPAVAADAPAASDKVESAQTFDAGIAMYVGMSVMAAAGSAVVLKKKD